MVILKVLFLPTARIKLICQKHSSAPGALMKALTSKSRASPTPSETSQWLNMSENTNRYKLTIFKGNLQFLLKLVYLLKFFRFSGQKSNVG